MEFVMNPINSPNITPKNVLPESSGEDITKFLPDEILGLIFVSDAEVSQVAPHVDKRWHKIATSPGLSLQALCLCEKPYLSSIFSSSSSISAEGKIHAMTASKDIVVVCIGFLNLVINIDIDGKDTMNFFVGEWRFSKFIGDILYVVSDLGVLSFYDPSKQNLVEIAKDNMLHSSFFTSTLVAQDGNRIALAGDEAILVYDAQKSELIKIITPLKNLDSKDPLGREVKRSESRYCEGVAIAGDRVCVSYECGPISSARDIYKISVFAIDQTTSNEIILMDKPHHLMANENQIVAFFTTQTPEGEENTKEERVLKSYDPMTLKEKYVLNEDALFAKGNRLDDASIDLIVLNKDKLYICNNGIFKIFNSDGTLFKTLQRLDKSPFQVTGAISFAGGIMALGVQLPDMSYAVEIWDRNQQLIHTFPMKKRPVKVILELKEKVQLIVGNDEGSFEVWNPEIEFQHLLKEIMEKKKREASYSGILSRVWNTTKDYFWRKSDNK